MNEGPRVQLTERGRELIDDHDVCRTPSARARRWRPFVLALQPTQADAQGQPAPAPRALTYEQQQEKD